jgi:hypothetical protein
MLMYDSPMLDSFRYECTLLEHVRVPDGMGGSTMAWTDGMKFDMVFERDASTQALIAEQQGFTSTYKGYVAKTMAVKYHDVLRRVEDGKIFRVTRDGDDNKTPKTSALDARCIVMERWELPTDD